MDELSNTEVETFKQTLGRLNRNLEVTVITPLDNHILDAFNAMTDLSKLRVLLGCCLGNHASCSKPVDTATADSDEELSDIEKANNIEMIRLKTWTAKAVMVVMGCSLFAIGLGLTLSGKDPTLFIAKNIEFAWKVFGLIFS